MGTIQFNRHIVTISLRDCFISGIARASQRLSLTPPMLGIRPESQNTLYCTNKYRGQCLVILILPAFIECSFYTQFNTQMYVCTFYLLKVKTFQNYTCTIFLMISAHIHQNTFFVCDPIGWLRFPPIVFSPSDIFLSGHTLLRMQFDDGLQEVEGVSGEMNIKPAKLRASVFLKDVPSQWPRSALKLQSFGSLDGQKKKSTKVKTSVNSYRRWTNGI